MHLCRQTPSFQLSLHKDGLKPLTQKTAAFADQGLFHKDALKLLAQDTAAPLSRKDALKTLARQTAGQVLFDKDACKPLARQTAAPADEVCLHKGILNPVAWDGFALDCQHWAAACWGSASLSVLQ